MTDTLTALDVPALIEQAAALIERDGLCVAEEAGLWDPPLRDDLVDDYVPGCPVDVAGALAVVCGWTQVIPAEDEFLSAEPPRPVIAAVLAGLGLTDVDALYAWTDEGLDQHQAVSALRACAAVERIRLAA